MKVFWTNSFEIKEKHRCIKTFVMRLRCASAPQFFDRVPGDRAVRGASPSSDFFPFLFALFFLGFLSLF